MKESDILHETKNLSLRREGKCLAIYFEGNSYASLVGIVPDIESGKKTMEKLERYPANLRAFQGHN